MKTRIATYGATLMAGLGAAVLLVAGGANTPEASAAPVAHPVAQKAGADAQLYSCDRTELRTKPTKLEPGCSSAHQYFTDLGWLLWGSDAAVGEGSYHVNKCEPTCAAGNFETHRAWIVLSAPSNGIFTKETVIDAKGQWTTDAPLK